MVVAAAVSGGSYLRLLGPSNGIDDTAQLNAALAAGGYFRGKPGETYRISAPLVIHSDSTLDMHDCTILAITGLASNMLANYSASNPIYNNEDSTATVGSAVLQLTDHAAATNYVVGQTVIQDGAGGSGGPAFSPGAIVPLVATVTAVDAVAGTVTIDRPAKTSTPAWGLAAYNRDKNIRVIGGKWDRGSFGYTGLSINGNSLHFRHVDSLTVEIDEFNSTTNVAHYPISVGDVTDYTLSCKRMRSGRDGIHIMGPAVNGRVSFIAGYTADDMVSITASDYAGGLTDVAGDVIGFTWGEISGKSDQSLLKILAGVNKRVDEIVGGLIRGTATSHVVWLGEDTGNLGTVGGSYGHIDLGTVSAVTTNPTTKQQLFLAAPSVESLRARLDYSGTTGFAVATGTGGTGGASGPSTAVLEHVHLDLDATGPGRLLNMAGITTTIHRLVLDGRYKQVSGASVALAAASRIDVLDARLDATLTAVLGSGLARLFGRVAVDVSLLIPADGDWAVNTNAALGCGVGLVVWNAAAGKWKNLYTTVTT